ncbi:MAG TPA: carboxypeptidase-like regulatory domain-containing protein [Ignavibacteriaceae bacterium]|nr:carboxypeptidase-like regulatory domain-containing protein [Ignavibacteriaceae bacterium]
MLKSFLIILLINISMFAGVTGKLSGTIRDSQNGEPLVGANILIEGTGVGAASDINGNYVILNIPPGVYKVKITYLGYESIIFEDVKIIVDQTTRLNTDLKPKSISVDEIVITAKTPLIQKDITSSISVMTRDELESLPVQSFTEVLSLQAGVIGSGSNLHIRGGRSNEVAYLIDGMYVQDPLLGGLATDLSKDAIQEMSLLSGTFNAEYGDALSGVVNIVTRDGSDKLSGRFEGRTSQFGIERYNRLGELRFNGSLGGPLLFINDSHFFLSAEHENRKSYLPFGYDTSQTIFTKLTTSAVPSLKISITNRGSRGRRQNYSHAYKYIPDQYLKRRTDSWQSILALSHTVANNFFYDLRISYFNQGFYSGLNKDTSQYISTGDYTYFPDIGTGFEFYQRADPVELIDSRTVTTDLKADAVWQIDQVNEVKFGGTFKQHKLKYFNVYDPKRNFPYINNYSTNPFELAGYLQDKIEFPYLIINIGLRYDYLNANVEFRADPLRPGSVVSVKPRTQFSPRIGIAHPISERTKLHFAYGHFFQNPEFQFLFENKQYDVNVREPLFGQASLDAQRTIAYEVGIAHQFSDRIALNITAYYKDVTGLIGTHYYFPFVDGRYTGYTLYVNEDYANMKGFEVNLDVRPNQYFSGGLTYTYSVAKGSASSETEQYPGTEESTQLYYLDFDKTHVFNASGTFTIPKNEGPEIFGNKLFDMMDFSLIIRASSGYPYTPSGRDVGFVEKNSLRLPFSYNIDLLIGKSVNIAGSFDFRLFAEILNLTDHRDVLFVYGDTGDPNFTFEGNLSDEYMRDPSNFGPPRSIRIGAGIEF